VVDRRACRASSSGLVLVALNRPGFAVLVGALSGAEMLYFGALCSIDLSSGAVSVDGVVQFAVRDHTVLLLVCFSSLFPTYAHLGWYTHVLGPLSSRLGQVRSAC